MFKELGKYFDHYTIHARFLPVFFVSFPIVLTVFAWLPDAKTVFGGTITVLISFGVMSFLSIYVSNIGNDLQDKLFNKWQGAPTTLILLPNNETLDKFTKLRYFKWINHHKPDLSLPESIESYVHNSELTEKIKSSVNFLREYTRDKKKYEKIYRDNVAYGFSRNLVALRYYGILICMASISTTFCFMYHNAMYNETFHPNTLVMVSTLTSVVFLIIHFFMLNHSFVKRRAYRYALSLFEVCESI